MIGSFEMQKVPSWAGWISKTATDNESTISNVEYLAPLSESINENSTVRYILDKSLAASQEVGQEYAIVTFDLAKFSTVWQSFSQNGCFPWKMMNCSGLSEIILESGICASGSLNRVMNGKHFNKALRVHKLVFEALQRLLLIRFVEMNSQFELLSQETHSMMMDLIHDPCKENVSKIKDSEEFKAFFQRYRTFTSELLDGNHGKTAQFWMRYMDIVQ